jgi:Tol biopolymer transport system component
MSTLENGYWTKPQQARFSTSMTNFTDPFISPSGDRLFFLSKGKIPGSSLPEKENIWFVDRTPDGWGQPQPVSEEINTHDLHWQVSVNTEGDLYFTSRITGNEDIYISRYVDGKYATPERLSDSINTQEFHETTPLIAPDSSYLIFARMDPETNGAAIRLYISYADGNGSWSEPALISQVEYGLCPLISPDGRYLFFLSSPQAVSWMSTDFIEELRPGG